MKSVYRSRQSESGFVAIFTVMFFIILISVLTLGFIRVMLDERQQSVDNDLTATALNAAETGVEDGKRLLLYCSAQIASNGPSATSCKAALAQTDCPGIFAGAGMASALGVDGSIEPDGSVRVASDADFEQHYTCLLVNPLTDDYVGALDANQSDLIPLKSEGGQSFNRVELSWHMTTSGAQGSPKNYPPNKDYLPTTRQWQGATPEDAFPAYTRVQYIEHDNGNIDLTSLDTTSRTAFLTPLNGGVSTINPATAVNLNSVDSRTGAKTKNQPVGVQCIAPPGVSPAAELYACRASIVLNEVTSSKLAYLRVTALYGATDFKLSMYNNDVLVRFDGTQPIIDSTGRSNDVFRRVQARVRLDGQAFYPAFALESGKSLCKNMLVTNSITTFADSCNPTPPPPCSGGRSDITLTLDASSSMNKAWETGTRREKLREVALTFVNNTEVSDIQNREAIIKFSNPIDTKVIQGLTGNINQLESAINSIVNDKGTHYIAALDVSENELYKPSARPGAPKVLVLVSDGQPIEPEGAIYSRANELKAKGVRIYTIGVTVEADADSILANIANGGGGRYIKVTTEADLTAAMQSIGEELKCL